MPGSPMATLAWGCWLMAIMVLGVCGFNVMRGWIQHNEGIGEQKGVAGSNILNLSPT